MLIGGLQARSPCPLSHHHLSTDDAQTLQLLPCSASANTCLFQGVSGTPLQDVYNKLPSPANYDTIVYLLPPNNCDWSGLGLVNCIGDAGCWSLISPGGGGGLGDINVILHEVGHNINLAHSSTRKGGYDVAWFDCTCSCGAVIGTLYSHLCCASHLHNDVSFTCSSCMTCFCMRIAIALFYLDV